MGRGAGSGSNQGGSTSTFLSGPSGVPLGQPATFTVIVEGSSTPTGTVSFYDNGALLGSATLEADGSATFTTSDLTFGDNVKRPSTAATPTSTAAPPSRST